MNELFSKLCCLFLALVLTGGLQAQATLSFQGILKKSNGVAVEDGTYAITFTLYNAEQGGVAKWTETQPEVEVTSGIYSVLLGTVEPLAIAFDTIYYLGIKVGSAEMTPRFKLTSAPYALSLIGQKNLFPSTGTVKADSLQVEGKITTAGIRARGGVPGLNGVNNNGYAFQGNGGDNDSGLFSTTDGTVSLYANNKEVLTVSEHGVNGVNLSNNSTISYNGLDDWRLVYKSNITASDPDGWQAYSEAVNGTPKGIKTIKYTSPFIEDYAITRASSSNNEWGTVLKRAFNLEGLPHNEIRVVFTYYIVKTWDNAIAWAGFQEDHSEKVTLGWVCRYSQIWKTETATFEVIYGNELSYPVREEMVIHSSKNNFLVVFGGNLGDNWDNEHFALSNIELWVR